MSIVSSYHQIIRKIIIGFGSIFDDITLVRTEDDGSENQRIKVPLIYAAKEKYVARIVGDPDLDKKIQVVLPRMSFDLLAMEYDPTRKLITNIQTRSPTANPNLMNTTYNPVPYNFDFSLYLYVRNIEDGTQIIEHILPYFTPDYTLKLNLVPEMGLIKEVPIVLKDVTYDVEFEGDSISDTRVVIWTLNFTAKAFLYGNVYSSGIIKETIINIFNLNGIGKTDQVEFTMANTGFGSYKTKELVFQGYSLGTATATAEVVSFSNTTHKLVVTNLEGNFKSNTTLVGASTQSEFTLKNFTIANTWMATIDTKVTPNTATSNSTFSYVTTIQEHN